MSVFGPAPRSVLGSVFPARGFSPRSLFAAGEVGVWYDPSDLTTLFQDDAGTTPVTAAGQRVGRILDKSGRGNHATQATLAQRPTYQIDAGGRPYLEFDGIDDSLATGTITPGADKAQLFAGVRKLSDAATGALLETSVNAGSNNGVIDVQAPSGASPNYRFGSRGTIGQAGTASGFPAPSTNVFTGLGDISGDRATLRINGTQVAQATADQGTGNFLAYTLFIGRRGGSSLPFNGHIYNLVVRFASTNLPAAQIAAAERWMAGKTGVVI